MNVVMRTVLAPSVMVPEQNDLLADDVCQASKAWSGILCRRASKANEADSQVTANSHSHMLKYSKAT